jgi:hypothetical protein
VDARGCCGSQIGQVRFLWARSDLARSTGYWAVPLRRMPVRDLFGQGARAGMSQHSDDITEYQNLGGIMNQHAAGHQTTEILDGDAWIVADERLALMELTSSILELVLTCPAPLVWLTPRNFVPHRLGEYHGAGSTDDADREAMDPALSGRPEVESP